MPPLIVFALISGTFLLIVYVRLKSKKSNIDGASTYTTSSKLGSITKTFEEMEIIRLRTPGYDKVVEHRSENQFTEIDFMEVAGVHTNNIRNYFDSVVKQYQFIELVPEPTNPKNTEAIAIKMGRKRLGYIPNSMLSRVWEIYKRGRYFAYISQIDWDDTDKNYSRLSVKMVIEY